MGLWYTTTTTGILLYVRVGANPKEHFIEHSVTFDYSSERMDILQRLEKDAAELQRGITEQNPSLVKHSARDPTYIYYGTNWLCNKCPYKNDCDAMRRQAGEFV